MKIVPVVEGDGDLLSVQRLLARLIIDLQIYDVSIHGSIHLARTEMVKKDPFLNRMNAARKLGGDAVLFVFDADKSCARDVIPDMHQWAKENMSDLPCGNVMARREYEVWFLASMETMRGANLGKNKSIPESFSYPYPVEQVSSPKSRFQEYGYKETLHQHILTSKIDFALAYRRSSSFRKLVQEVCRILVELGKSPVVPPHWATEEVM
jgi:hypothetical protein